MIECNGYASICVGGGTVWFVVIYHLCWPGGQVREFCSCIRLFGWFTDNKGNVDKFNRRVAGWDCSSDVSLPCTRVVLVCFGLILVLCMLVLVMKVCSVVCLWT